MAARRKKSAHKPTSARGNGGDVRLNKSDAHLNRVMDTALHKARITRGIGDPMGSKIYMSMFHSAASDSFERPRSKRRGWAEDI